MQTCQLIVMVSLNQLFEAMLALLLVIGDWWKMVIYVDIDGQEVTAAGHDSILYS